METTLALKCEIIFAYLKAITRRGGYGLKMEATLNCILLPVTYSVSTESIILQPIRRYSNIIFCKNTELIFSTNDHLMSALCPN